MEIDGDDPHLNCYNQIIIAHWCIKYKVYQVIKYAQILQGQSKSH